MANYQVRPSLSIALFKSLNTNLLDIIDNLDKNININRVDNKLTLEAVANQAFFEKNISFYSNSDSKTNTNSNSNFDSNFDAEIDSNPDFQDKKIPCSILLAILVLLVIILVIFVKNWSKF